MKKGRGLIVVTAAMAALGLLAGALPASAATTAGRNPAAAFPSPGVYHTSPTGVQMPNGGHSYRETILATVVSLSGFEVIWQATNISASGTVTIGCALGSGKKTAKDTHLIFGKTSLAGYTSTCTTNPSFRVALQPRQSLQFFVEFPLPPPVGVPVKISTIGGATSSTKTYETRSFDPYGAGTGLKVILVPPPSGQAQVQVWDNSIDLAESILELFNVFSVEILDIHLLNPWMVCGSSVSCLQQQLPSPMLPALSTT